MQSISYYFNRFKNAKDTQERNQEKFWALLALVDLGDCRKYITMCIKWVQSRKDDTLDVLHGDFDEYMNKIKMDYEN